MDSVTQVLLGASIGVAVMGRRTALWKSALWGGVAGLLPDLDVLLDHGDPILNMIRHRAETHALLLLTLFAFPMAWVVSRIHRQPQLYGRWWWALMLALVTHPLLDLMTIYGTQVFQPFTDEAYGLGSMFIIDPLYSLPLLVGVVAALRVQSVPRALAINGWALAFSTAYLAWSALGQAWVTQHARQSLQTQGLPSQQLLVTPAPLNTVLWRVVALDGDRFHEGFYSFFDGGRAIRFDAHERGGALAAQHAEHSQLQRLARFTDGFFKIERDKDHLLVTDLRMGQEPDYVFAFDIGMPLQAGQDHPIAAQKSRRMDVGQGLTWLGQRILGRDVPPPGRAGS
ncbi:metal-dependent hydrolase [uncultured Limnohabitans sp.]|uniref:metal-dependent hydrolase n=1 Tax=uncultured Limnohabitans sp. TaxID=768543 RepID=UPI00261FFDE5|nr:metal-dependent hydrolase [uncultured Limnohabitans sp.]